jgi:hypothetical protein
MFDSGFEGDLATIDHFRTYAASGLTQPRRRACPARGALRDTVRRQRKSDAPREIGKTYTGTYYESGIHYPDQPLEAEREPAYCDPLKVRSDAVGTDGPTITRKAFGSMRSQRIESRALAGTSIL